MKDKTNNRTFKYRNVFLDLMATKIVMYHFGGLKGDLHIYRVFFTDSMKKGLCILVFLENVASVQSSDKFSM